MRESRTLEFKENVSATFLKTVSAYANYGTGVIMFGVADDGTVTGIADTKAACHDIENRINDSIDPVPEYSLSVNEKTSVITLTVSEGLHKPYLYKAKAYRRNDSSTIAADRLELARLILEGQNSSFEELPASSQQLTFDALGARLAEILSISAVTTDTLKTLELYTEGKGFNKAGELIADVNSFRGVDIIRFGEDINTIRDRETGENISILRQFDLAVSMYRKYYQYEKISGTVRETVSTVPEAAFREAIANALVHRTWDVDASISVAMFPDRIEITSPGGLPAGVSEEAYLTGGISILRNRVIGNLFFRLRLIERFGTGIRRIQEEYRLSAVKPRFDIGESSIRVTLPALRAKNDLKPDENKVYMTLKGRTASSSQIAESTGFGKSKTISILDRLVKGGYIRVTGSGRGTRYAGN